MRIGGIRLGRRRLAALAVATAVVVLPALAAGLLGAGWRGGLVAAVAGTLLVAFALVGYAEHRRTAAAQAWAVAGHEEQLRQLRAALDQATTSAGAHAEAVWAQVADRPATDPGTFVLYRIIGNDLPPRHRAGQSLDNLRFILAHEPDLPGCQKRWVLNRIVDPAVEKEAISLLEEHGMPYLRVPFEVEAYRRVGWRFDGFPVPGFTYRPEFAALSPTHRQWALDQVYHDKNLYVMNNNGARNAALRQGRELARWVMPWDGNCFLTRPAWDQLRAAVAARPYLKYFTVPMARILDNQLLLRPDPDVDPSEEPQVVFRSDAREQFNENARYGRCPKVELFWRLGYAGAWDQWCLGPWDPARPARSPEAGQFGSAGWVARLYSGERDLERDIKDRGWRRLEAVRARIDRIDEDLAARAFDPAALFALDEPVLDRQRERWRAGEPGPSRVVGELLVAAERDPGNDLAGEVTVATLAGYLTGERRFLSRGADLLKAAFLASPPRPRAAAPGDLYCLLDAARLLEREGALAPAEVARLRAWLTEHRAWLRDSDQGRAARAALDHAGTWHDVGAAAVDAYLDDLAGVLATLRRSHERLGQQFDVDGSQPAELSLHHRAYNLQGWSVLAGFARRVGQDLWSYRTADGRGLAGATGRLCGQLAQPAGDLDRRRLVVLAHRADRHLPSLGLADRLDPADRDPYRVAQVFDRPSGIRPFWILGDGAG
jgi:hypothetical protein